MSTRKCRSILWFLLPLQLFFTTSRVCFFFSISRPLRHCGAFVSADGVDWFTFPAARSVQQNTQTIVGHLFQQQFFFLTCWILFKFTSLRAALSIFAFRNLLWSRKAPFAITSTNIPTATPAITFISTESKLCVMWVSPKNHDIFTLWHLTLFAINC